MTCSFNASRSSCLAAMDAAIGANAVLGLVEPTGCGIGGDLFAIVWDAQRSELRGLNGSGRSPRSLTLEALRDMGLERIPAHGPLSVSVPGAVDGWFTLHETLGLPQFPNSFAEAHLVFSVLLVCDQWESYAACSKQSTRR